MRVNSLNTNQFFKGTVNRNKIKLAQEIDNCPQETQESLIGNINTLKSRLEECTPFWKTFTLDFEYYSEYDTSTSPYIHHGVVTVVDEKNQTYKKDFVLGQTAKKYSPANENSCYKNGEEIWEEGFKELTQASAYSQHEKPEKYIHPDFQNIYNAIEDVDEELDFDKAQAAYNIKWEWKQNPEIDLNTRIHWLNKENKGAESMLHRLEDRGERIELNKSGLARRLYEISVDCPQDIVDSIIGNINTLTKRIETSTSKYKNYDIGLAYNTCGLENLLLVVSSQYERIDGEVKLCKSINNTSEKKCLLNSQQIWDELFKPVTEKVLWDGYNNTPYQNGRHSQREQAIFDRLI